MVEHTAILQNLQAKGFPDKWCVWIQDILSTGTSSILLNGIPSNDFQCKRGVRQVDPLSPLLFVLATDLLQSIINKAYRQNLLGLPLPNREVAHFPIVHYADDTILFLGESPTLTLHTFFFPWLPFYFVLFSTISHTKKKYPCRSGSYFFEILLFLPTPTESSSIRCLFPLSVIYFL